jgi:hypothetical protein
VLTHAYEALLKDRAIIAAEVMHEYDEKVRGRREAWGAAGLLTAARSS